MKENTFKVIRNEEEEPVDPMLALIERDKYKKPELNAPYFPDASKRPIYYGMLGRILKKLKKP